MTPSPRPVSTTPSRSSSGGNDRRLCLAPLAEHDPAFILVVTVPLVGVQGEGGAGAARRARSSGGTWPALLREVLAADSGQGYHARGQRDDGRDQENVVQAGGEGGPGDRAHGWP